MKHLIPGYLLEAAVRHYEFLSAQAMRERTAKTANAKRMAGIEIRKLKNLMAKQKTQAV